jgi:hypothetical protein
MLQRVMKSKQSAARKKQLGIVQVRSAFYRAAHLRNSQQFFMLLEQLSGSFSVKMRLFLKLVHVYKVHLFLQFVKLEKHTLIVFGDLAAGRPSQADRAHCGA